MNMTWKNASLPSILRKFAVVLTAGLLASSPVHAQEGWMPNVHVTLGNSTLDETVVVIHERQGQEVARYVLPGLVNPPTQSEVISKPLSKDYNPSRRDRAVVQGTRKHSITGDTISYTVFKKPAMVGDVLKFEKEGKPGHQHYAQAVTAAKTSFADAWVGSPWAQGRLAPPGEPGWVPDVVFGWHSNNALAESVIIHHYRQDVLIGRHVLRGKNDLWDNKTDRDALAQAGYPEGDERIFVPAKLLSDLKQVQTIEFPDTRGGVTKKFAKNSIRFVAQYDDVLKIQRVGVPAGEANEKTFVVKHVPGSALYKTYEVAGRPHSIWTRSLDVWADTGPAAIATPPEIGRAHV